MSNEREFVDGLIVKPPRDRAPEYVKAHLSIKRVELISWLSAKDDEWINLDVKVSQGGKWYASVNDWKPDGENRGRRGGNRQPSQGRNAPRPQQPRNPPPEDDFSDDELPF